MEVIWNFHVRKLVWSSFTEIKLEILDKRNICVWLFMAERVDEVEEEEEEDDDEFVEDIGSGFWILLLWYHERIQNNREVEEFIQRDWENIHYIFDLKK